jgi:hypothetical protein
MPKTKRKEKLVGVWCNKREEEKLNKLCEKYNIRDYPKMFRQLLREKRL